MLPKPSLGTFSNAFSQKKLLTFFQDADFQTLRKILSQNALGKIMEAELHYDFESPPWLSKLTQKEYTPGSGLCFGLGE